jgi:hypothetical protein
MLQTKLCQWEITGKMYNKNCDKTCTDLKLRYERKWKLYATNQVHKNQTIGLIGEWCETIFCLLLAPSVE